MPHGVRVRPTSMTPLRICFLIRDLGAGGAQRQLAELVRRLDKTRFEVTVLTFYPGGLLWSDIEQAPGVRLVSLDKAGRWDVIRFGTRLFGFLRRLRPDVVHPYLDLANVLGWVGGRAVRAKVVWGVRASNVDLDRYDWLYRVSLRVSAVLSRYVDLVIFNSQAGLRHHVDSCGYHPGNTAVVPNGIDTERFRPLPEARLRTRQAWGVGDSDFVLGLVGRLDPMKDHDTFLEAAVRLAARRPHLRLVCVGDGPEESARCLAESPAARVLGNRLRWEPARPDVECVLGALDCLVLSAAYGEGILNVVAEAMAAEVPCVVTDVGDAAALLADPERTVHPADPEALAGACQRLVDRPSADRLRLAAADRRRIVEHFGTDRLVQRTAELLKDVACA